MNIIFLLNYLQTALKMLPLCILLTVGTFIVYIGIKTMKAMLKKETCQIISFKSGEVFLWILTMAIILMVTGIIGSKYGLTSPFDGTCHISFKLIDEGITWSGILNIVLFIPYGFMSYIVFKNIRKNWLYGLAIGAALSFSIEFLQTFIGRFTQLEDILTNSTGTLIGYFLCILMFEKLVLAKELFTEIMAAYTMKLKVGLFTVIIYTRSIKL